MKTIWKYPLSEKCSFAMPQGAKILTVARQNDESCLWALVDSEAPLCRRTFVMLGTGHEILENNLTFLGSVQYIEGAIVMHVFEKNEDVL